MEDRADRLSDDSCCLASYGPGRQHGSESHRPERRIERSDYSDPFRQRRQFQFSSGQRQQPW